VLSATPIQSATGDHAKRVFLVGPASVVARRHALGASRRSETPVIRSSLTRVSRGFSRRNRRDDKTAIELFLSEVRALALQSSIIDVVRIAWPQQRQADNGNTHSIRVFDSRSLRSMKPTHAGPVLASVRPADRVRRHRRRQLHHRAARSGSRRYLLRRRMHSDRRPRPERDRPRQI
jgi:hypothetical protein